MPKKPEKEGPPWPADAAVCGNCAHMGDIEPNGYGYCFANPPVVLVVDEEPMSARPVTEVTDQACRHFKQRLVS